MIWQMIILILRQSQPPPPPGPPYKTYVTVTPFESFTPKLNKRVFSDKNKEKSTNCLDHYVHNIIN